jgi:uncharacterized membrane protein YccC
LISEKSLRDTALSGGLWTGDQVALNKVVSLGGTVVMMYLLHPKDYGLASLAISLLAAVTLLAPFTLIDVLLSRPAEADRLMGTAMRLCAVVTVLNIAALPPHHHQVRHGLLRKQVRSFALIGCPDWASMFTVDLSLQRR